MKARSVGALAIQKSWKVRAARSLRDCKVLHPYFPPVESETQTREATCPRSHYWELDPMTSDFQASTPSKPAKGISPTSSTVPLTKFYMILVLEMKRHQLKYAILKMSGHDSVLT